MSQYSAGVVLCYYWCIIGAFFLFMHCPFTVVLVVVECTLNSHIPVSDVVMLRYDFFILISIFIAE